ncbi:MAG: hypothetical protein QOH16_2806 [Gaiellaceae bacterium]|jgi:site-specific recombinase XerD|nr:hypothetical protein [Gaiellaceae bacterium]
MHPLFTDYLTLLEEGDRSQSTLANNRRAFDSVCEWSGNKDIRQMRQARHARVREPPAEDRVRAEHVERYPIVIRAGYRYAHSYG